MEGELMNLAALQLSNHRGGAGFSYYIWCYQQPSNETDLAQLQQELC